MIGPSGSGKSTFLRCLNLLEKPNGGTITIRHRDYEAENQHIKGPGKHRDGFSAFSSLSAQNGSRKHHVRACQCKKESKQAAQEKAEDLLRKVGLFEKRNDYPNRLSGGQNSVSRLPGLLR